MEYLLRERKEYGYYAEWSVNEKVAAEVAIASSVTGLRSMVSMKGVGVNVASEPFQAFTYMGTRGGIVLVVCDDPSCHSSHTEQDNRLFAAQAYLPVFEPSDPQEALDMARESLLLSEKWRQPVMLRSTTVLSHGGGVVKLGDVPQRSRRGEFAKEPERWVNLPANARRMKRELLERFERITEDADGLKFNRQETLGPSGSENGNPSGIVSSGPPYSAVKETANILSADVDVLKLGMTHPLPLNILEEFLAKHDRVLVVEELEPLIEQQVAALAHKKNLDVEILGKELVPRTGELNVSDAVKAVGAFLDISVPPELENSEKLRFEMAHAIVPRPPILCAGCGPSSQSTSSRGN
jgi:indolepyruvate ferredoxin oxidoreductase alpha subunit